MADIFISYAREDLERVRPIVRFIEDSGWSVFWDRTIPPGMTWRKYIGKALDEAKCVIVIWSFSSVKSEFVQEEADDGREQNILIPIRIDDVRPPLGFRAIQHEDLSDWKGEANHRRVKSLVKAIEDIAGKPKPKLFVSTVQSKSEIQPPKKLVPKPKSETPITKSSASTTLRSPSIGEPNPPPPENKYNFLKILKIVVSLVTVTVILNIGFDLWFKNKKQFPTSPPATINKPSAKEKATVSSHGEPKKDIPKADTDLPKTFKNSIGMDFLLIPAGSFKMGSAPGSGVNDEHPQHPVEITHPFYLQTTEVTQEQWKKVMGDNPSKYKKCGNDCPVETVSWNDAQKFIKKLNDMEGTDTYRLPTEAEWEYAARAGTTTEYSFGDDAGQLGRYGWYAKNSGRETHPAGGRKPNAWGLYDMHGNVWEWCQDWYGDDYYKKNPDKNPKGPQTGIQRVIRGGGWYYDAPFCRSATRAFLTPDFRYASFGFRLVRTGSLGP